MCVCVSTFLSTSLSLSPFLSNPPLSLPLSLFLSPFLRNTQMHKNPWIYDLLILCLPIGCTVYFLPIKQMYMYDSIHHLFCRLYFDCLPLCYWPLKTLSLTGMMQQASTKESRQPSRKSVVVVEDEPAPKSGGGGCC